MRIFLCKNRVKQRGQFFSPDLILAVLVFSFGLVFFLNSSNGIFNQVDSFESKRSIEHVAHNALDSLVLSPGVPVNWDSFDIVDVNSIGLAYSPNFLSQQKVSRLGFYLDNNYSFVRSSLGLSKYFVLVQIIDFNGDVVFSHGQSASNKINEFIFERSVFFNNRSSTLRGVFSHE